MTSRRAASGTRRGLHSRFMPGGHFFAPPATGRRNQPVSLSYHYPSTAGGALFEEAG